MHHVCEDIIAENDLNFFVGFSDLYEARDTITAHQVISAENLHISRLGWNSAQRLGPVLLQWNYAVVSRGNQLNALGAKPIDDRRRIVRTTVVNHDMYKSAIGLLLNAPHCGFEIGAPIVYWCHHSNERLSRRGPSFHAVIFCNSRFAMLSWSHVIPTAMASGKSPWGNLRSARAKMASHRQSIGDSNSSLYQRGTHFGLD